MRINGYGNRHGLCAVLEQRIDPSRFSGWRNRVMALRAELYCYFCGHGLGEVLVPTSARRPTVEQLRTAYENVRGREAPVWNEGDQPLCPRCGGQLFLERFEHEVIRGNERRTRSRAAFRRRRSLTSWESPRPA